MILLLILWEFHIMYPDHTHFLVFPGLPPALWTPPLKKETEGEGIVGGRGKKES